MEDLSDVIALLGSGTYTVTRPSAATSLVDGRRVAPATTTFTVVASVQPSSGRSIDRLPEGLRARESMDVWTATKLQPASPETGLEGDRIAIDGSVYEVQIVHDWQKHGSFCRATAVKVPA